MTALLLAAALWAMPAPGGPAGMGDHGTTAQPLQDRTLPASTVSVLVRNGRSPATGARVALITAQGTGDATLMTGTTNAEGRVFLKAATHVGQRAVVAVWIGKAKPRFSVPFTVPRQGGVRFLFLSGGARMGGMGRRAPRMGDHDHGKAGQPPPAKAQGKQQWLQLWVTFDIIAIENEDLFVSLNYRVLNRGPAPYHPGSHGLLLPVPAGAKHLSLPQRIPGVEVSKNGILVTRGISTSRHGLPIRVNGKFKIRSRQVDVRLRSPLPLIGYAVVLKAYRRVRIEAPDLAPPDLEQHAGHGSAQRVYRAKREGYPKRQIGFTITGLPQRSRARSWPFAAMALLLVLAGLGLALRRRSGPRAADAATDDDLERLVQLERDRRLGLVDDDEASQRKAALLGDRGKVDGDG